MTDYTIKRFNKYSKEELLSALRGFVDKNGTKYVASRDFCRWLGISPTTVERHFGKWSSLCNEAGISPRYDRNIDHDYLFQNLETVWEKLGRQPRAKEMKQPLSPVSISKYQREFKKTWYEICLEFVSWKSGASVEEIEKESRAFPKPLSDIQHKTNRSISLSLRYNVLKRDNFKCVMCGNTPALSSGVQLHIDHIVPWSGGGETIIENLQTLCSECNLGKSDKYSA
ncbi:MAG: HNH endonuclease [Candidatus Brocadia sp. AMX2]|uniref:Restriction endonuclease n=1 Tax=Candidatus Brocadia sinica JPN1 TaxID=1197129 RepID=A0ABQ0JZ79_9BACT|nr:MULTISPECIES: HNH endonuclease [Brocadia]MBC6932252.1 HNH endonuclease [Candidatus Brocadia sp.]MBL1168524.1 HNH endonuclease [Candidatus Brocadia sp. AMX1]NOG40191.1 HNH endonuclease [Planctomycetota bacterium]GIK14250.1 MAG: hypothetical protein BroJett002_29570 [Candidatus Brocadia sinica]KAA0243689.1 MAG: HNH endonuclease [Candidatus Brocadia sp. AMX2]